MNAHKYHYNHTLVKQLAYIWIFNNRLIHTTTLHIIEKQQSNTNGKYLLIVLRGREDNYNFRRILHELSKQPEKQSIRKLLLPGHEVINSYRAHETFNVTVEACIWTFKILKNSDEWNQKSLSLLYILFQLSERNNSKSL